MKGAEKHKIYFKPSVHTCYVSTNLTACMLNNSTDTSVNTKAKQNGQTAKLTLHPFRQKHTYSLEQSSSWEANQ